MARFERGFARFDLKLTLNASEMDTMIMFFKKFASDSYGPDREFGEYGLERIAKTKER